jgi:hypothetical protein
MSLFPSSSDFSGRIPISVILFTELVLEITEMGMYPLEVHE